MTRTTKRPTCTHPPVARECHNGYDISCGDCEALIGRVAIYDHDIVLNRDEAKQVFDWIGEAGEGSGVRAKLAKAAA